VEDRAALRPLGHAKRQIAKHTGHVDLRAKDQLRVRNECLTVEILAVTLKSIVFLYIKDNENVTARTTTRPNV
jgi:hypothetical protein